MGGYYGYMIIGGLLSMIGVFVSNRLKSKFAKYSQEPIRAGYTGAEVAKRMLDYYGIHDVQITQGQGALTDHYNPQTKIVNLSPDVFQGRSIASAAVAAHECGHAVQHATAYPMLKMRSSIVPIVSAASKFQQFGLIAAFMLFNVFPQVMLFAIAAFFITTLFSLITLPVEYDASNRALAWLDDTGTLQGTEYDGAKDALKWAALTYVAAALSAVVMLLYLVMKYTNRR